MHLTARLLPHAALLVLVGASAMAIACGSTDVSFGPDGGDGGAGATDSATGGAGDDAGDDGSRGGGPADAGVAACGADGGLATTTDGVQCTYAYSAYNASASVKATSTVQWSCAGANRTVTGNGIPDHETGTFPNANCPNTIRAQSISQKMPLAPRLTSTATNVTIVGYARNGVKFDPNTAGTCSVSNGNVTCSLAGGGGAWHIEALGQSSFDFGVDDSNAHVQPDGWYHYHGVPTRLLAAMDAGVAPTLVGFAVDGFPIYARYGYSSAMDATSPVRAMKGSYRLKASPDPGRPSTATYPMGAFTEDYEYAAGSGDLDECNGRVGVTPEFPCGIYHYYITDTYPFIGRCEKGTPASTGGPGGGGGGGGGPGGGDAGACNASGTCDTQGYVCCPNDQPCAGSCVPDCRLAGNSCPSGLTCDTNSGVCKP